MILPEHIIPIRWNSASPRDTKIVDSSRTTNKWHAKTLFADDDDAVALVQAVVM